MCEVGSTVHDAETPNQVTIMSPFEDSYRDWARKVPKQHQVIADFLYYEDRFSNVGKVVTCNEFRGETFQLCLKKPSPKERSYVFKSKTLQSILVLKVDKGSELALLRARSQSQQQQQPQQQQQQQQQRGGKVVAKDKDKEVSPRAGGGGRHDIASAASAASTDKSNGSSASAETRESATSLTTLSTTTATTATTTTTTSTASAAAAGARSFQDTNYDAEMGVGLDFDLNGLDKDEFLSIMLPLVEGSAWVDDEEEEDEEEEEEEGGGNQ
jgi:hypothetical protein